MLRVIWQAVLEKPDYSQMTKRSRRGFERTDKLPRGLTIQAAH